MTTLIKAKDLTLEEVHARLGFVEQPGVPFENYLEMPSLSEYEQQELVQIRSDFKNYYDSGRVSEGLIKALTTYPLLRLAGFYRAPIRISLEQDIAEIVVEDEDVRIRGTMDLLVFNRGQPKGNEFFWVLVIEAKNSTVTPSAGLPQLLTYAYNSLERQEATWGLLTNGDLHQFVYLQAGSSPIYQLMPILTLMQPQPAIQILQVLRAIGS